MQNIISFAKEYQLKDFDSIPFSAADSLILSQVAYYNYEGTAFEKNDFASTLKNVVQISSEILLRGVQTADEDKKLIKVLKLGGRHGNLAACSYKEISDTDLGEQFAALTFRLKENEYYIAFRGTDTSLTGWKEDMCLSFQDEIPAQKTAVKYATEIMNRFPGKFYIGGHSKGGNLAVYSAMHLPEDLQDRLIEVYNHDGPGFFEEVYESKEYKRIRSIIRKTVPQSSVVGMLLEYDDNYIVVESHAKGLMQHVPYSWTVENGEFCVVQEVDRFAYHIKQIMERWLSEISFEKREQIVEIVFDIFSETGINAFGELTEESVKKIRMVIESIAETDEENRKLVGETARRLIRISADELQQAAKEQRDIKKEELIILRDSLKETKLGETIKETIQDSVIGEKIKESVDFLKAKSDNKIQEIKKHITTNDKGE